MGKKRTLIQKQFINAYVKYTINFVDVEDFATRVKYLDMAFKLKGKYSPQKHEIQNYLFFSIRWVYV